MSRSPIAVDCRLDAPRRRASAGFSLVELMTVIAIIGILAAFAAPAVKNWATNQRMKTTSFDLVMSMMLARSESTKRRAFVYIKPTPSELWKDGWCVMLASGTDCSLTAPGDDVIRVFPVPNTLVVTASQTLVTFSREGRLLGATDPLDFWVGLEGSEPACPFARHVRVELSGSAKAITCSP